MLTWSVRTATLFWPGFRKAWTRSEPQSVIFALLFAWLCIVALIGNWYWPQWYPTWLMRILSFSLVSTALYQGVRLVLFGDEHAAKTNSGEGRLARDQCFQTAQECYLQAAYFEAEQYLLKNLAANENDIESALLLASVCRRSGKFSEAVQVLSQLQLRENAAPWMAEILVEKDKAIRAKRQTSTVPPPKA
jgi:hypothetical protein